MRKLLAVLAVVAVLATAQSAWAAFWDGGAGTTSWSDAANWNPDGVPASGAIQLGANNVASPLSGTVSADGLTFSGLFTVGTYKGTNYTLTLSNSTITNTSAGYMQIGGQSVNTANGLPADYGRGTMILDNTDLTVQTTQMFVGGRDSGSSGVGVLDISNGSTLLYQTLPTSSIAIMVTQGATLPVNGQSPDGTIKVRGNSVLTIDKASYTSVGASSSAMSLGGTSTETAGAYQHAALLLGDATGGGTVNMLGAYAATTGDKAFNILGGANKAVGQGDSKIKGYGAVSVDCIGKLSGAYNYNGSIISDRMGATGDKVLDLTGTPHYNLAGKTTTAAMADNLGMFANSHSAIKFAATPTPAAGANVYAFPVNDIARTMGMINTYNIKFASLTTAGTLQTTLLAKDFGGNASLVGSNVAASDAISVFEIDAGGGLAFTNAIASFQYDAKALADLGRSAADLKLFFYDGAAWSEIPSIVTTNSSTQQIATATSSLTASNFGTAAAPTFFAIGFTTPTLVPEPATMALLVLGGIGVLARRRRK